MKRLIVFLVGVAFVASAAEYGHFSRTETTNDWSHSVVLNEGDLLTILNTDDISYGYANESAEKFIYIQCVYSNLTTTRRIKLWQYGRLNDDTDFTLSITEHNRTITGPCTLIPSSYNNATKIVDYKIVRAFEENESSKYNASLNADGSRLAIALKQAGSNAVTRVYEFDGSSWNQLGDDVE